MARALLYYGVLAFAASCKPSAPTPVDAQAPILDAAVVTSTPIIDASPPISDAGKDAGDTVAVSHGKVTLVSDADARSFAGPFIGAASFVHPVFSGNFGPSPRTVFGITQPGDPMATYVAVVLAQDDAGTWKKIESEPLTDSPWNGWSVDAVLFEDIDGKGTLAPIVIAQYMTGIGPTGAQPFVVVSVYRYTAGKMVHALDVEKILSGAEDAKTIRARLAARKTPKKPAL